MYPVDMDLPVQERRPMQQSDDSQLKVGRRRVLLSAGNDECRFQIKSMNHHRHHQWAYQANI